MAVKLSKLIPQRFRRGPIEDAGRLRHKDGLHEKLEGRFNRQTPEQAKRPINTPKRQPCPLCRRLVKRKQKTTGGAQYYCKSCQNGFFVRAM